MPEAKNVNVSVNTGALLGKFLRDIQNLLDIIMLVSAGLESVTEEQYRANPAFMSFQPAVNQSLTLDDAKNRSKQWLLTSFLTDSVNVTANFLDECRKVCALYRLSGRQQITAQEFLHILTKDYKRFHKAGSPDKFKSLRDDFRVQTPFEEHFLSLNRARNCLVHRRGLVSSEDADEDGRLAIKWSVMELVAIPPGGAEEIVLGGPTDVAAGSSLGVRVRDRTRAFALGERITLETRELYQSIFTLFAFAKELVKSIEAYGEALGVLRRADG